MRDSRFTRIQEKQVAQAYSGCRLGFICMVIAVLALSIPAARATLTYDFADDNHGWVTVGDTINSASFLYYGATNGVMTHVGGAGNTDASHPLKAIRSPLFTFSGGGNLTFKLARGNSAGADPYATFLGVAVRRSSDREFILSADRSGDSATFEAGLWTEAEIGAATLGDAADETYSFYLIDNQSGSWGWVELDDVSIPGELSLQQAWLITNVTATASSEEDASRASMNAVNESGFDGLRVGTTDAAHMWNTANGVNKVDTWVKFDLGATHNIGNMWVFNYNISGTSTNREFVTADVWISQTGTGTPTSDPDEWERRHDDQSFTAAPYTTSYKMPQRVELKTKARYVLMNDIVNSGVTTWGNSYGLSEVQFYDCFIPQCTMSIIY